MSYLKPFSQSDYDKFNIPAQETAWNYLSTLAKDGQTCYALLESIKKQKELYKDSDFWVQDIIRNKKVKIEAEVKDCWFKHKVWQGWPTVDVPYRKKDSKADVYVMTNRHHDAIFVCPMRAVLTSQVNPKVTKVNNYEDLEDFFNVNPIYGKFVKKVDSVWIVINV